MHSVGENRHSAGHLLALLWVVKINGRIRIAVPRNETRHSLYIIAIHPWQLTNYFAARLKAAAAERDQKMVHSAKAIFGRVKGSITAFRTFVAGQYLRNTAIRDIARIIIAQPERKLAGLLGRLPWLTSARNIRAGARSLDMPWLVGERERQSVFAGIVVRPLPRRIAAELQVRRIAFLVLRLAGRRYPLSGLLLAAVLLDRRLVEFSLALGGPQAGSYRNFLGDLGWRRVKHKPDSIGIGSSRGTWRGRRRHHRSCRRSWRRPCRVLRGIHRGLFVRTTERLG